jgi:PAS domain-containing protein
LTAKWAILSDLEPGECEVRLRRSDGVFHWFLFRIEPLRDEVSEAVRWYGTATDIEDRKRIEALRAAEKRTLEMIADGASLRDILNELCCSIDVEASPVISAVLLMDPDGERLRHTAGPLIPRDWLPAISPVLVSPNSACCGAAAFLKKRVIVADVATHINWPDEFKDLAIRNGIRAVWSEPILTKDGEVLGTFALYSSEPRIPTDAEIELIEAAGHIALIAIERQRSRAALTTALHEIAKSEGELRTIIDAIPQLIVAIGADGNLLYANQALLEYTGLRKEEVGTERTRQENALREQIDQVFMFDKIVGSSPALKTVLSGIVKVAPTDSTVLISGETGTGKELIARAIHKSSQRAGQAFISVNLRRDSPFAHRLGIVWPREGRLHRCSAAPARSF